MIKRLFAVLLAVAALCACGKEETPGGGGGEDVGGGGSENQPGGDEVVTPPEYFSTDFMKGATMCFAQYMADAGLKYRENGAEKDPYASMKAHGANIVRLQLNFEDFKTYNGATIDWASWRRVLADAKKAYANGLDVLLTLKPDADDYSKQTTDHNLVPAAWKSLTAESKLGDALYDWVYKVLCDLAAEGIYPRVVAVGNEVSVGFLRPDGSAAADAGRTGRLLKRGFEAVDAYASKYNPNVKTLLHVDNPRNMQWFISQVTAAGCTGFDIVGSSWYPGTNIGHTMGSGSYATFGGICSALKTQGYDFMILETAHSFTTGTVDGKWMGDNCNNSYNYPDWSDDATNAVNYTPAAQRKWLGELAAEIKAGGGAGLVTWGTESLPSTGVSKTVYTYPASWAAGSTWENNSYWDFTDSNNLHEGIDWMQDVQ